MPSWSLCSSASARPLGKAAAAMMKSQSLLVSPAPSAKEPCT
jgi:hypothetical protein